MQVCRSHCEGSVSPPGSVPSGTLLPVCAAGVTISCADSGEWPAQTLAMHRVITVNLLTFLISLFLLKVFLFPRQKYKASGKRAKRIDGS